MGGIAGMFGLGGGNAGTGQAAPVTQNVIGAPISQAQTNAAYTGTQSSLQQQQALLQALQGQNALTNQNQVYGQLQGVVNGTGPNPAQAMLNQSTGQNIAAQSALMAGQRGVSQNPGLIARQIAQQGAATQQQAVGQGATLQANQSLNALGQAGSMANTQAANVVGQTNANVAAQQAQYNAMLQAQANLNQANVSLQSNANSVSGQLANTQIGNQANMVGGLLNTLTPGTAMFADGGEIGSNQSAFQQSSGPQSEFGQFLNNVSSSNAPDTSVPQFTSATRQRNKDAMPSPMGALPMSSGDVMAGGAESGVGSLGAMALAARGGKVPAMVSPGEKYLKPQEARAVAKGKANPAQVGMVIPGKPKVNGDSYQNDTVPAKLDEGGVVIPNSVMQSKDPVRGAAEFVRACMAKKGLKK